MLINHLKQIPDKTLFLPIDKNGRIINYYIASNIIFTGVNLIYPNLLFFSNLTNQIYRPIDEKIMSLKEVNKQEHYDFKKPNKKLVKENTPVFFFAYNTDNYYHFIYDTLPYLITYTFLKTEIPDLKLLMTYPNKESKNFYLFVREFLELLDITKEDILIINNKTEYSKVYFSDSYTHGLDSNLPPREEIYNFYKKIVNKVTKMYNNESPKNIYVSRRTWLHNDFSNIGTNYTNRRKLMNEDELVVFLQNKKYKEIFTEKLSTIDKILMFAKAKKVIGSIGGGTCNVLFSNKKCNFISLNSPGFLDVNKRFEYSFKTVNYIPYNNTRHYINKKFKLYMRVKVNNIVGEIIDISKENITINYSTTPIAGWNSLSKFKTGIFNKKVCIPLDNGLNSPWYVDIENLKTII